MGDVLAEAVAAEVRGFPEFRLGVHRVGVRLTYGVRVDDVLVSGDRATTALGRDHVPFDAADVIEVVNQSERPSPPGV